ncbi:methylenetetrahydrofolate reductase [NAD(P)H] [Qingshengfaniella alkalisoli]|uniref:Methylenetetrahydrofolate reductase n=1 Tax=Qingshengfaniella alkalisoli TaxID=2599296 RepID=A0A5B8J2E2_9RHOB|nr:methylenetetrahydrofolate reductase [NAD(P)H] [Qingshengfaniella alkalisoli]QDY68677.1 methylenetetrahydrofolate reductase [NAD(P)H] [Qingshengfaniella alkalisoli]
MSQPRVSFEFFPPKSLDASFKLWETVRALAPLDPSFVSVTYGAGGTTRKLTHEAVTTIEKNYGLNVAAHLTCVDASRDETMEIVKAYSDAGITELVALRGDPPKGSGGFTPHPEGFANSCELIEALADTGKFNLRVGAYPDPHPEARGDPSADVRWLKRKFQAGAHSAITQFFFEPDTYFRFRDACASEGIDAPIIPGIIPIESWKGVRKFATACGTPIPAWFDEAMTKAEDDGRTAEVSAELCVDLCRKLLDGGVDDLHFYTLNKPELTKQICAQLGITPKKSLERVA